MVGGATSSSNDGLACLGSPPRVYPPAAPELRDILAAGGMRNARDDASSVGADAGTDAGSIAGGSIAGGGGVWGGGGDDGGSGSDGEVDAASGAPEAVGTGLGLGLGQGLGAAGTDPAGDERQEALDMFVSVTQESREKAAQFLGATDWRIDSALNLFMESGGEGAPAPTPPGVGGGGGGGGASDRARASSGSRRVGAQPRGSRLAAAAAGGGGGARGLAGGGDEVSGGRGAGGIFLLAHALMLESWHRSRSPVCLVCVSRLW